jgi:hypothetical protein
MALRLATSFKTLSVPEAYVRVISVTPDVLAKTTTVKYQLWSSKQHRKDFLSTPLEIGVRTFPYTAETGDIIAWAYTQLKTLQEFSVAEDIIDLPPAPLTEEEVEARAKAERIRLRIYDEKDFPNPNRLPLTPPDWPTDQPSAV